MAENAFEKYIVGEKMVQLSDSLERVSHLFAVNFLLEIQTHEMLH